MLSELIEDFEEQEYVYEILDRANALLIEAPQRVCGVYGGIFNYWLNHKECNVADLERTKILNTIEELCKLHGLPPL